MDKAKILNRVYASNLPSRAKTVMFYLVNRSNKELTCFPAIPTIARETGMSDRTVQRALKQLCEEGYVEKSSRYRENNGQSSNLYRLVVKEDEGLVEEVCEAEAKGEILSVDFFDLADEVIYYECHRVGDIFVPPRTI